MYALLASLALLGAAQKDTTYDLLWHPQLGQQQVYAMKMEGKIEDMAFKFDVEVHTRVADVAPNGDYTLGTQFKNGHVKFGEVENSYDQDKEELQHYNKRGDLLDKPAQEYSEGDQVGEIMGQTTDFLPPLNPVKLGDKWNRQIAKNSALKLPGATVHYELASKTQTDGHEAFVIPYSYAQDSGDKPVRARGIVLLDAKDFSIISVKADVENLVFGEGVPPSKGHLEMTRVKD